jgi:hypothetical protein
MTDSANQVETIKKNLANDITHVLLRPSMYVGDIPCAPFALDAMIYALCRVWASITGQWRELGQLADEAYERRGPGIDDSVNTVVDRWRAIAQEIQIPMYSDPAKKGVT